MASLAGCNTIETSAESAHAVRALSVTNIRCRSRNVGEVHGGAQFDRSDVAVV
jgi:hypothetical protein